MKTPLFLFAALIWVCMFSGCRESIFYNAEIPCGKVNGNVKKVTDTVYVMLDGEMKYPLRTSEYHFDSLHRLVEEHYCFYYTERYEKEADAAVSLEYRRMVKNRYDRNGRIIESEEGSYTYTDNGVDSMLMSMRLVDLKGNNEVWERTYHVAEHEKEYFPDTKIYYRNEKNRLTVDYPNENPEKRMQTVSVFDDRGNITEFSMKNGDNLSESTTYTYIYDDRDLLTESVNTPTPGETTYYQYDEFDNEGNWLKMLELDKDKNVQYITRRRIEYRIGG